MKTFYKILFFIYFTLLGNSIFSQNIVINDNGTYSGICELTPKNNEPTEKIIGINTKIDGNEETFATYAFVLDLNENSGYPVDSWLWYSFNKMYSNMSLPEASEGNEIVDNINLSNSQSFLKNIELKQTNTDSFLIKYFDNYSIVLSTTRQNKSNINNIDNNGKYYHFTSVLNKNEKSLQNKYNSPLFIIACTGEEIDNPEYKLNKLVFILFKQKNSLKPISIPQNFRKKNNVMFVSDFYTTNERERISLENLFYLQSEKTDYDYTKIVGEDESNTTQIINSIIENQNKINIEGFSNIRSSGFLNNTGDLGTNLLKYNTKLLINKKAITSVHSIHSGSEILQFYELPEALQKINLEESKVFDYGSDFFRPNFNNSNIFFAIPFDKVKDDGKNHFVINSKNIVNIYKNKEGYEPASIVSISTDNNILVLDGKKGSNLNSSETYLSVLATKTGKDLSFFSTSNKVTEAKLAEYLLKEGYKNAIVLSSNKYEESSSNINIFSYYNNKNKVSKIFLNTQPFEKLTVNSNQQTFLLVYAASLGEFSNSNNTKQTIYIHNDLAKEAPISKPFDDTKIKNKKTVTLTDKNSNKMKHSYFIKELIPTGNFGNIAELKKSLTTKGITVISALDKTTKIKQIKNSEPIYYTTFKSSVVGLKYKNLFTLAYDKNLKLKKDLYENKNEQLLNLGFFLDSDDYTSNLEFPIIVSKNENTINAAKELFYLSAVVFKAFPDSVYFFSSGDEKISIYEFAEIIKNNFSSTDEITALLLTKSKNGKNNIIADFKKTKDQFYKNVTISDGKDESSNFLVFTQYTSEALESFSLAVIVPDNKEVTIKYTILDKEKEVNVNKLTEIVVDNNTIVSNTADFTVTESIDFGNVIIGNSITKKIIITNKGNTSLTLEVTTPSFNNDFVFKSNNSITLDKENDSYTILVYSNIKTPLPSKGEKTATVTVTGGLTTKKCKLKINYKEPEEEEKENNDAPTDYYIYTKEFTDVSEEAFYQTISENYKLNDIVSLVTYEGKSSLKNIEKNMSENKDNLKNNRDALSNIILANMESKLSEKGLAYELDTDSFDREVLFLIPYQKEIEIGKKACVYLEKKENKLLIDSDTNMCNEEDENQILISNDKRLILENDVVVVDTRDNNKYYIIAMATTKDKFIAFESTKEKQTIETFAEHLSKTYTNAVLLILSNGNIDNPDNDNILWSNDSDKTTKNIALGAQGYFKNANKKRSYKKETADNFIAIVKYKANGKVKKKDPKYDINLVITGLKNLEESGSLEVSYSIKKKGEEPIENTISFIENKTSPLADELLRKTKYSVKITKKPKNYFCKIENPSGKIKKKNIVIKIICKKKQDNTSEEEIEPVVVDNEENNSDNNIVVVEDDTNNLIVIDNNTSNNNHFHNNNSNNRNNSSYSRESFYAWHQRRQRTCFAPFVGFPPSSHFYLGGRNCMPDQFYIPSPWGGSLFEGGSISNIGPRQWNGVGIDGFIGSRSLLGFPGSFGQLGGFSHYQEFWF